MATARKLLGPDAIIGVTASTIQEALTACEGGADYLGIGTVYATSTKTNTKNIIGSSGVREILDAIADAGYQVPTVCIGGINATNLQYTVFQCGSSKKQLDGVAVVSAIIAAPDPKAVSEKLLSLLRPVPPFQNATSNHDDALKMLAVVPDMVRAVHEQKPLSHNMTNLVCPLHRYQSYSFERLTSSQVVQNFAANVALSVGGSPIMAVSLMILLFVLYRKVRRGLIKGDGDKRTTEKKLPILRHSVVLLS